MELFENYPIKYYISTTIFTSPHISFFMDAAGKKFIDEIIFRNKLNFLCIGICEVAS